MTDAGDSDRSASAVRGISSPLPLYIDIRKAFDLETVFEGSCSLERLPRFADCLASPDGEISGKLRLGATGTGRRVITGSVSATVEVFCQRCLEPLSLELTDTIQLALVESESQIDSLEAAWDPWIIDGPKISIASLLEEQLMLCMPLVSYHRDERCVKALEYQQRKEPPDYSSGDRAAVNPFEVLKVLKKNDDAP
ncbi:MAG: YceD family protein [Pseudomonadota bacterium]|nr:YceD family protein [Pseudomonadota bacterium]